MRIVDKLGAIFVIDSWLVYDYVAADSRDDPHGFAQYAKRPFAGAPTLPPLVYVSHDPGLSTETFLVALHELGHLTKGRRGGRLEHEAFAWRFALKQAGPTEQPDADIWARIARDLRSYADTGKRCRPSKDFNHLLAQAERMAT